MTSFRKDCIEIVIQSFGHLSCNEKCRTGPFKCPQCYYIHEVNGVIENVSLVFFVGQVVRHFLLYPVTTYVKSVSVSF